jgi:TolB-like protein/Tfp pilus assembly protein PilF/predicted Ser/Thr protein kinase
MDADRWRRISWLYHEARERPVDQRDAFLDACCEGDLALREEVALLLQHTTGPESFVVPAVDASVDLARRGRLGTYQIERILGRGGMGIVFLAHDTILRRNVALKVLSAPDYEGASQARLLREARNAASLNHPNICTVYEVGQIDGLSFIAMEFVEGRPLSERLAASALPVEEVVRFGIEAADALAFAHEHGVIHRDLKAANAIVTATGRLKLVDFGLARREDASPADATTVATLAPAGVILGTPYAMAPEQVRGGATDARTDIWALGVLLYEMATGTVPFAGRTIPERFAAILSMAPVPLPTSLPAALRALIERCLEKDPAKRFAGAAEVRDALEAIRTGTAPMSGAWRSRVRRHPLVAAAAGTLVIAVVAAVTNVGGWRTRLVGTSLAPVKLVVLPFENLTGDPEQEYFSDGLTEEMITRLGRLRPERLKVIGRTSAMTFKNREVPIDTIGQELGVHYVLEGSARREGSRVRIDARLIQVRDGTQRWADSFDRELAGILALQNDVARGITRALALSLLPAEEARLADSRPVNPAAYEAYLMGQSHAQRLTRQDLDRALEYYEAALKHDPQFALAYFGISGVWAGRIQTGQVSPAVGRGPADAALKRAIALDETLPETHLALANGSTWTDWDWRAAEEHFRRALDLNPNSGGAHSFHSHYLYIVGRPKEGAAAMQRAIELDPLNDLIQQFYGMTLAFDRRFEDALAHAERVQRLRPGAAWAALTQNYHLLGRFDEALSAQRNVFGGGAGTSINETLDRGWAEDGYRGAMFRAGEAFMSKDAHWVAAQLFMRATQFDLAIDALERAYEARNPNLPYISVSPIFDEARMHPRFVALLRKMGLPTS